MAVKLKKVLKREVFALAEGKSLGRPADLLVDPEQDRIALVVLSIGAVPELSVVARADAVQSFESDTLALEGVASLRVAGQEEELLELLTRGLRFSGRPVLSSEGGRLGHVTSVLVEASGDVVEYRIRKGPFGWLRPALRIKPGELRAPAGEMAIAKPALAPAPPELDAPSPDNEDGDPKS